MNLPNQERCNCECHPSTYICDPCYTGRCSLNHSTKDYSDLSNREKTEVMKELAQEADKIQSDIAHSTMEGEKDLLDKVAGYYAFVATFSGAPEIKIKAWKDFIESLLAKERESAERRGREEVLENISIIEECCPSYESPLGKVYRVGEWVLKAFKFSAARKDADV